MQKKRKKSFLPRMHIIRVNDSEGEPAALLGHRIGQDLIGERQEGGERYPNNHHHFEPLQLFTFRLHFLSNFTLLSGCFEDNETCGLDVVRLSEAGKKKEKQEQKKSQSSLTFIDRPRPWISHPRQIIIYIPFFFFFPKETKEQFRGSIDFEEVFALGNFPSNEERNKSSRTFSSSLIFVIVNAPKKRDFKETRFLLP